MHTFWVTFYSYKGGVGRSMALANVAAYLASIGRRVVMVDFDLEAPGLDSFDEFDQPQATPGVVEYVSHYLEHQKPAPVKEFVHSLTPKTLVRDKKTERYLEGGLWLMTSGAKNESYNRKRNAINWAELYDKHDGVAFFENFKADIEDTFKPDYVLVDSRTGLTDIGGVCTLHLPDLVVLLFALNEQNLEGTAAVARLLRESEKLPQIVPVATPVPNLPREDGSPLEQRFQRAKQLLGTDVSLSLAYVPDLALKEKITVWEDPSQLRSQYEELASKIALSDPGGLDFLLRQLKAALEAFEFDRADELTSLLQVEYADRPDTWLGISDVAKARGDVKHYEQALRKAVELSGGSSLALHRLEALLMGQKRHEDFLKVLLWILEQPRQPDWSVIANLHKAAGRLLMKMGSYWEASERFKACLDIQDTLPEVSDVEQFSTLFNIAESTRRASKEVRPGEWMPVIHRFEKALPEIRSSPLSQRANRLQAMHIAYACAGDMERAKMLLEETAKLISQASPQERLFCVADYDRISLPEFTARNKAMREGLNHGQLWDGMKLNLDKTDV